MMGSPSRHNDEDDLEEEVDEHDEVDAKKKKRNAKDRDRAAGKRELKELQERMTSLQARLLSQQAEAVPHKEQSMAAQLLELIQLKHSSRCFHCTCLLFYLRQCCTLPTLCTPLICLHPN